MTHYPQLAGLDVAEIVAFVMTSPLKRGRRESAGGWRIGHAAAT